MSKMKYISIDTETTGLSPKDCQVLEFGAMFEDTSNPRTFSATKKFRRILTHKTITGGAVALSMHPKLLVMLAKKSQRKFDEIIWSNYANVDEGFCHPTELADQFKKWLVDECGYQTNNTIKELKKHPEEDGWSYIDDKSTSVITISHEDDGVIDKVIGRYEGKVRIVASGKNLAGFDLPFLNFDGIKLNGSVYSHQRVIDPTFGLIDWSEDSVPPSLGDCKDRMGLSEVVAHGAVEDAWDVICVTREVTKNYTKRFY